MAQKAYLAVDNSGIAIWAMSELVFTEYVLVIRPDSFRPVLPGTLRLPHST